MSDLEPGAAAEVGIRSRVEVGWSATTMREYWRVVVVESTGHEELERLKREALALHAGLLERMSQSRADG